MVERTEEMGNLLVTVANVYPKDKSASFHVTSFIKIVNDKIISLDEYWADDSDAPQWRLDKHIGTVIKCEPDRDGDFRLFSMKKAGNLRPCLVLQNKKPMHSHGFLPSAEEET